MTSNPTTEEFRRFYIEEIEWQNPEDGAKRFDGWLEQVKAEAVAAERERAARIAESEQLHPLDEARLLVERPDFVEGYRDSGLDIAAAIREDS